MASTVDGSESSSADVEQARNQRLGSIGAQLSAGIGEGLLRLGMSLDENSVGTGGNGGSCEWLGELGSTTSLGVTAWELQ